MKILNLLVLIFSLFISTNQTLNPVCALCHDIMKAIQHSIPQKPSDAIMEKIATMYCVKKKIQKKNVCQGAVGEMTKYILNSVWRHYTDPHLVCHHLYMCPKQYTYRNLDQDIKKIIQGRPNKEWEMPTKNKILNVLHISDLHPDLYYTVGAPYKCSQPVCCRGNVTTNNTNLYQLLQNYQKQEILKAQIQTDKPAGYWGSIGDCDLPFQTFELFLKQIGKMKLDLIIWTGDNTPHDIWQQSQDYNINFTNILAKRIQNYTNATVIAAMGNHESWPVNVYDYQGDRQTMLNQGLAEIWRPWLTEQAYKMQRQKGYYSVELPKLNNLKIISLNTQAGNDQNWFLLRDPTDPGKMLDWIQKQLKQSQAKGQFVYLIGHIPPKSNLNEWAMRFYALVYRYSYIIRGQFYGHTHHDHLSFYPDFVKTQQLSNYYLVSPSLTTYSDKNPQYRVMQVDYDSLQVLNYDQYELHLQKYTKKEQNAHFEILYNFLDAYGLEDMTVKGGMTKLKNMLKNDPEVQKKYNFFNNGGLSPGRAGLDIYCDTTVAPQLQAACMNRKYGNGTFEKYAGKWKDLNHKIDS